MLAGLLGAIFLSTVSLFALPQEFGENKCVNDPAHFSARQKSVLLKAYEYGNPYELGYTLAAIAWKESCAGEYRMNFQDPSAGIYHAYLPGIIKKYPSLKQNGFTQNVIGSMLVKDDAFAAREAISELKYWEKIHKGNWEKMIKSYNKGFSWQRDENANRLATAYYLDVKSRMQKLQVYLPRLKLEKFNPNSKSKIYLPIYEKQPTLTPPKFPTRIAPSEKNQESKSAPTTFKQSPNAKEYGTTRVYVKDNGKVGEFEILPDK
ncbi:MAG: hypothetical protein ACTTJS_04045 [Wolinella sp.]